MCKRFRMKTFSPIGVPDRLRWGGVKMRTLASFVLTSTRLALQENHSCI